MMIYVGLYFVYFGLIFTYTRVGWMGKWMIEYGG